MWYCWNIARAIRYHCITKTCYKKYATLIEYNIFHIIAKSTDWSDLRANKSYAKVAYYRQTAIQQDYGSVQRGANHRSRFWAVFFLVQQFNFVQRTAVSLVFYMQITCALQMQVMCWFFLLMDRSVLLLYVRCVEIAACWWAWLRISIR